MHRMKGMKGKMDGGYNRDGMHKAGGSKAVLTKPSKMKKKGGGHKNFGK